MTDAPSEVLTLADLDTARLVFVVTTEGEVLAWGAPDAEPARIATALRSAADLFDALPSPHDREPARGPAGDDPGA